MEQAERRGNRRARFRSRRSIPNLTPIFDGCTLTSNFKWLMPCARSSAWIERRPAEPKVTRSNRVGHAIRMHPEYFPPWIIRSAVLTRASNFCHTSPRACV